MKNNKVYVDIGYTNIKVLINNQVFIKPVKECIKWLKELTKTNYCYVCCNNQKYKNKINKLKNLYLIKNEDFKDDIKIDPEFDFYELGTDLIAYCYWIKQKCLSDAIIVSSGTCLVATIIKNNILKSVQILSGFELEKEQIKKLLNDKTLSFSEEFNYFNLQKSINIAYINKIKGLFKINQEEFDIDKNLYLTGNYSKNFVINITDNLFTEVKVNENICLEAIKIKFSN